LFGFFNDSLSAQNKGTSSLR